MAQLGWLYEAVTKIEQLGCEDVHPVAGGNDAGPIRFFAARY
jgi:hypothetical protein